MANNHNAIRNYAERIKMPYQDAVKHAVRVGNGITGGAQIIGINRVSLHDFISRHNIEVEYVRRVGQKRGGDEN